MPDPARSKWIERRAGIGFTMSTQRRASRMIPAINTDRAEFRRLTAPLMSIIWLAWAWLCASDKKSQSLTDRKATNSLLSDRQNETLALHKNGSASAPPGPQTGRIGSSSPSGLRVSLRSSLRHVPNLLPVRAHLHSTLPIAPAGIVRWAERHDGKRDLYFQHAA